MSTAAVFHGAGVNHCINSSGVVHAAQTLSGEAARSTRSATCCSSVLGLAKYGKVFVPGLVASAFGVFAAGR